MFFFETNQQCTEAFIVTFLTSPRRLQLPHDNVVLEMRLIDIVIFMTLEVNDIARLSSTGKPNASLLTL